MSNDQVQIDMMFKSYQDDLQALVEIPSVLDNSDKDHLFGASIQEALSKILEISERLGFKTVRHPKGYYGYAEIGEGATLIGVLGHIDVVPSGDLSCWDTDPFHLSERDGFLYGRGVSDDKGPLLASMYALKLLLDTGYKLKCRVRFIFGTDEESLWRCVREYTKLEEIPSMGFTPDSSFPLIYAEKGLIEFEFEHHEKTDYIFNGGGALNAVPDSATVQGEKLDVIVNVLQEHGRSYDVSADGVSVYGKAVHAKEADIGENAIVYLAQAIRHVDQDNPLIQCICEEMYNPNGIGIFGPVEDEISGKMMLNVGKVETTKTGQKMGIDIRFPVTYPVETIRECIIAVADTYDLKVKEIDYLRSIHSDEQSFLVQSLMKAYQTVTGDMESRPMVSGGATYARALDNVVAYGAKLPHSENTEHQVNERVLIADMKQAIEIYMEAFRVLTRSKES